MNSIALFCGSAEGVNPEYARAAAQFGEECARRGITLYYGGAKIGLMNAAASAAMQNGGSVVGVVPKIFDRDVVVADDISRLVFVDSMSERKQTLERDAEAFVALPGGFGTMDELFEILTDAQLGLHQKPIVLLNTCGYYDLLVQQLMHFQNEGFLRPFHYGLLRVATDVPDLFRQLDSYVYGNDPQWLGEHLK